MTLSLWFRYDEKGVALVVVVGFYWPIRSQWRRLSMIKIKDSIASVSKIRFFFGFEEMILGGLFIFFFITVCVC